MANMTLRDVLTNLTYTENLALTYRSTLDPLLDFYYHAAAKRVTRPSDPNAADVLALFRKAYQANPVLAAVALFHLRDVRGGKGERTAARLCFDWLRDNHPDAFAKLIPLLPEYGRWDDVLAYHDHPVVRDLVISQLRADLTDDKPSLLAKWMPSNQARKWMPSNQASNRDRRKLADAWRDVIFTTPDGKPIKRHSQQYRLLLSNLRARLKIVERQMSAQQWGEINYPAVPSQAMLKYRSAFKRHDPERYEQYLQRAQAGEAKMNTATLAPYQIVHAIMKAKPEAGEDAAIEALWKNLPDYTQGKVGLVVADVSGSMYSDKLPGSSARPVDASIALAIYYAQRNQGPWGGLVVTFSQVPQFINITPEMSLRQAVDAIVKNPHNGLNTDFQAIFRLLLNKANELQVPPEQMPSAIWVISDMEFDEAGENTTNLDAVRAQYQQSGYPMPALIFWNVASRHMQTPALAEDQGVVLISGFSARAFQAALENKTITPYEAMMSVLLSERYQPVRDAALELLQTSYDAHAHASLA
jgi:hypothetical protein